MINKKELRKEILNKRCSLNEIEVIERSQIICDRVKRTREYEAAENICLYMPIRNEVDVMFLKDDALSKGKRIWLPKVESSEMNFYYYNEETELAEGAYGIKEPVSEKVLQPDDNTLVIMPGAVFSFKGDRIGYGGGYYDKYLEKYPMCNTMAVCYDFQLLNEIPREEHDIQPERIVSDINIEIKKATIEDAELLVEYMQKLGTYQKMRESIVITAEKARDLLERGAGEAIFGCLNDKPVSFIYYYENSSAFIGERGLYIDGFYIEEELRGHGFGKQMMKYMAKEAIDRGCKRLEWVCLDWNELSINFYMNLGSSRMDAFTTYRLAYDTLVNLAE